MKANRVAGAGDRLSSASPTLVPKARASGDSGSGRTLMKRTLIAATTLAAAVTLGGCGGGDNQTLPPASSSPTAQSSPAAPSSTPPAWQSKFTPAQLKTYNAALKRWKEYLPQANAIYAEGVDTPGAEAVFKKYAAIAPSLINQLKTGFEDQGIRLTTPEKALWWKPTKVGTTDVSFVQCSDVTVVRGTQNGKPVRTPYKSPRVLTQIEMSKPKGYSWLIYGIKETSKPCAATD